MKFWKMSLLTAGLTLACLGVSPASDGNTRKNTTYVASGGKTRSTPAVKPSPVNRGGSTSVYGKSTSGGKTRLSRGTTFTRATTTRGGLKLPSLSQSSSRGALSRNTSATSSKSVHAAAVTNRGSNSTGYVKKTKGLSN